MKKQIITITLLLTLTIFMTSCGGKNADNKTDKTTTEQTENQKYQCPMKCEGEKTYDKQGKCPVCNMDLEQVKSNTSKWWPWPQALIVLWVSNAFKFFNLVILILVDKAVVVYFTFSDQIRENSFEAI